MKKSVFFIFSFFIVLKKSKYIFQLIIITYGIMNLGMSFFEN